MIANIRAEAERARAGKKARIMAKMNSLLEPQVIQALYEASCAGVPGLSENIHVRSIVGRFLEHARVFYFYAQGAENVYLSSSDWMDRNFFRRVEIAFPVLDPALKQRVIHEAFRVALRDNQLAWRALPDGQYTRVKGKGRAVNVQAQLMQTLGA